MSNTPVSLAYLQRTLRFLRSLPLRSLFFILRNTSILQCLGCKPPYSLRTIQNRKIIRNVLYVLCLGIVVALPFFLRYLADAKLDAAQKLAFFTIYGFVLFVLCANSIFDDYFFIGNFLVKALGRKSFELHDSFQSMNARTLYSHAENAVNELFRNGADSVIMKSHILGGLNSLQVHRLGGLLKRRCIGVGCGLLGEPMSISAISLLIGWILGVSHRSRCRRELVLLRSIDGFNSKQKFIRLF